MAKLIEQNIVVNISKIVPSDSKDTHALTQDQYITLISSIAELASTVLDDPSCVVEIKSE